MSRHKIKKPRTPEMTRRKKYARRLSIHQDELVKARQILASHRRSAEEYRVCEWAEMKREDARRLHRWRAAYHEEKVERWEAEVDRREKALRKFKAEWKQREEKSDE